MKKLILLSITDFKLIFRDPSLRVFLVMPLLIYALVLFLVPKLAEAYPGFEAYIPVVLMGATMQTSTMFGFIYSMVLIHEKELEVAKVYGILPVSKTAFVTARLLIPFGISALFTFVLLLIQGFFIFDILSMVLLAILCGLFAPLLTLVVCILSKNKMEGMTWFKLVNLLVSIPLAAYFIPAYTYFFGIIPTHWAFQVLDKMVLGQSIVLPLLLGFSYALILLFILIKRFAKVHFR
jgi:fluoroquinolone transport system permease protein